MAKLRRPRAGRRRLLRPSPIRALPLVVAGALGTVVPLGCGGSERSNSSSEAGTNSGTDMGDTSSSDGTGTTGRGGSGDTTDTTDSTSSTSGGNSGDGGATSGDGSTSSDGSGGSSGGKTSSDASTSGDGSGGSGGDVAECDSLPPNGASCEDGAQCQVPGSPCGTIFTCSAGTWQRETVCPEDPECPAEAPSESDGCSLTNPAAGVQVCLYDEGCGQVQADCAGDSWSLQVTPASTACSDLCEDLCTRLVDCGVSWAESCMRDCSTAYACPGETVGQDAAICELRQTDLSELACGELCEAVTGDQDGRDFGEGCGGL